MTWRMEGLIRRMWAQRGSAAYRCLEGCVEEERKSPTWAGRRARDHTRQTGHVTRTAHIKVTEYRRAQ